MGRPREYTCEDMIDALKATKGMVYAAAERLGCSHVTVYNYIHKYPSVEEAFEHERGRMLDQAEIRLYQAVNEGEVWAIQFALKLLGGGRGYASKSKQEITGTDGEPITIRVVYDSEEP